MKRIALITHVSDALSGYDNFSTKMDQSTLPGVNLTHVGSFLELDQILDDNEVDEILVKYVVDYYNPQSLNYLIDLCLKKLAHGGRIIFESNDFYTICKLVNRGDITMADANRLLRSSDNPLEMTVYNHSMLEIKQYILNKGLQILASFIRGYNYVVTGIRQ